MARARLTRIGLRNFKSFGPEYQELRLKPLTVLVGRNNSGKSTVVQSLLLLKQTLKDPRPEVELALQDLVHAFNLRELTFGWPEGYIGKNGPELTLEWSSTIDLDRVFKAARNPLDREGLTRRFSLPASLLSGKTVEAATCMRIQYLMSPDHTHTLSSLELTSRFEGAEAVLPTIRSYPPHAIEILWGDEEIPGLGIEWDHFLPRLKAARLTSHASDALESFRIIYEQPLEDLKALLLNLRFLGAMRAIPSPIYLSPTTLLPDDVGVSGEYAAPVLKNRERGRVHYMPLPQVGPNGVTFPTEIRVERLITAVNRTLLELGIIQDPQSQLQIEDLGIVGFRLLLGKASLLHVGRGISYALPEIVAGLLSDPVKAKLGSRVMALDRYLEQCPSFPFIAMEEVESHLHPQVQTRLAHFLVSMARAGRQLLIETHSDHLVRRLRRLIALAKPGSPEEAWLRENVAIVEVQQEADGSTRLHPSMLTPEGGISTHWPRDFMEVASEEEDAIFYAGMKKPSSEAPSPAEDLYGAVGYVEGEE